MPITPVIRRTLVGPNALSIAQQATPSTQSSRSLAARAIPIQSLETKTWLANFEDDHEIVPVKILQTTWEKDKSTLRARTKAPLNVLEKYVPAPMVEGLKSSRFYTKGSDSLVMQSAIARQAKSTKAECLKNFHNLLREVARKIISEEDDYIPSRPSKRPVNTMSTSKSRHEFQAEGIKLQKANMAADTEARLARQEKEKQRLREISEKNRRSNR